VAKLNSLVEEANVLDAQPGQELFKEGDSEKRAIYVFSGTVALLEGDHVAATITGGTEEARNPPGDHLATSLRSWRKTRWRTSPWTATFSMPC